MDRKVFLSKKEKEVIALLKRLNNLISARNKLGYLYLNPPIRKGWARRFVFCKNVQYRKDLKILTEILPRIQNIVISDNKDFLVKTRRKKKTQINQSTAPISDKV